MRSAPFAPLVPCRGPSGRGCEDGALIDPAAVQLCSTCERHKRGQRKQQRRKPRGSEAGR